MKKFLIKLLGGFTVYEFDLLRAEANSMVESCLKQVDYHQAQIKEKDSEIKRLTDLMLTRAEFILPAQTEKKQHESLNTRRSWPQIQRDKEREDAKRYADEIERRWKAKSGAVSEGNRPAESNG